MRKPIHPRNHYHRNDIDAIDITVTLDGVVQPYVIEANVRGRWVVRYVLDKSGHVTVNKNKPTELLTEKVYGRVTVSRTKEAENFYNAVVRAMEAK